MNALEELNEFLKQHKELKDARFIHADISFNGKVVNTDNKEELKIALNDMLYYEDTNKQQLYGEIYLLKGNIPVWLTREECNGYEWWNINYLPSIYNNIFNKH